MAVLFRTLFAIYVSFFSLCLEALTRADLLALLCVVFSCVFVTSPIGVPGRVTYQIGNV